MSRLSEAAMKSEEYESWFVDGERPMTAPEPTAALDLRDAQRAGKKTMIRLENGLKYDGLSLVGAKVMPGGLEDDDPVLPGPRLRGGRRAPAPPPVPADVARDTVKHDLGSPVPTANLRDRVVVAAGGDEVAVGDDEQTCVGRRASDALDAPSEASILETEWNDGSTIAPIQSPLSRLLAPLTARVRRVAARPEAAGALSKIHRVVSRAPVVALAAVAALLFVGMTAAAMAGPERGSSISDTDESSQPIVPLVPASSAPAEIPSSSPSSVGPGGVPELPIAPPARASDEAPADEAPVDEDGPADFDFTADAPSTPGSGGNGGQQQTQEETQRPSARSGRAARIRRMRIARARRARIARVRALRARRVHR